MAENEVQAETEEEAQGEAEEEAQAEESSVPRPAGFMLGALAEAKEEVQAKESSVSPKMEVEEEGHGTAGSPSSGPSEVGAAWNWGTGTTFKCKWCDDEPPLVGVYMCHLEYCWACRTLPASLMNAVCPNCYAIVFKDCIHNGELNVRDLDLLELWGSIHA